MSNISGVSGAVSTIGPSLDPGVGLDADSVLLYCRAQLNDLNSEIKAKMEGQRQIREQKQMLNDLRTALSRYSQSGVHTLDYEAKKEILTKYAELLNKMPPGPSRDAVMSSFNAFRGTGCYNNGAAPATDMATYLADGIHTDLLVKENGKGDNPSNNALSKEEVQDRIKDLENTSDELGKDAELDMIGLQKAISERQTRIQATTNWLTKLLEGPQAIINNWAK